MYIPTKKLLYLFAIGIVISTFPIFLPNLGSILWLCFSGSLLAILTLTAIIIYPLKKITFEMHCPKSLYVGSWDEITVEFKSPLEHSVKALLRIEASSFVKIKPEIGEIILTPQSQKLKFLVKPLRRGKITFSKIVIRITGYLGLWNLQHTSQQAIKSSAIPNLRGVAQYALEFYRNPQARAGVKIDKHRGQGSEFESLREYRPGFDIRTIDWKASARKAKLVCREFRAEKNHDILLVLDSGHLMATEFNGLTKLDYAINAILLLSYMAVKSGDRVGFFSFSDQIQTFLRPGNDEQVVQRISNACNKIPYTFPGSNFTISLEYLLHQQKQRSLIIFFTDFVDSISAEIMKDYLHIISKRHLLLFVSIRDPFLDTSLDKSAQSLLEMHRQVACHDMLNERLLLLKELRRQGIHCLDLFPDDISVPVLNQYINIRRKELI